MLYCVCCLCSQSFGSFRAVKLQPGNKENNGFCSSTDNAVCYINKGISSAVWDHSCALGNFLNGVPLKNNPCLYLLRYKLNIWAQPLCQRRWRNTNTCCVSLFSKPFGFVFSEPSVHPWSWHLLALFSPSTLFWPTGIPATPPLLGWYSTPCPPPLRVVRMCSPSRQPL